MTDKDIYRDVQQLLLDYHEDMEGLLSVFVGYVKEKRSEAAETLQKAETIRAKLFAVHDGLKQYYEAVTAMRVSQKQYFKTKTQKQLNDCKRVEGYVDALGDRLAEQFKLRPDAVGVQKTIGQ